MKELFEKTTAAVRQATAIIGKIQEPQYMAPPTWPEWTNLKLVKEIAVESSPVENVSVESIQ